MRVVVIGSLGIVALAGCAAATPSPAASSAPAPSVMTSAPGRAATPAPSRTPAARDRFASSVQRLPRQLRQWMNGISWRPGCPVGLRQLRLITLKYRSYGGETRTGRLVAHRDAARDLVTTFRVMYRHDFPVRRMRLADHYGGSDMRSIKANNTSAFNCRAVPGSSTWSQHAYGRAVDINPVQNPYWQPSTGYVEPKRARRFLDRPLDHPGMIHEGGPVVRVFDRLGWGWGGRWQSLRDWQHFSVTGR